MTSHRRRLLAFGAAGLLTIGALAGCGSDDSVSADSKQVTVKDGNDSVTIGAAKVPKDFPSDDVPLPEDGDLNAVVNGERDGKKFFSLTYTIKVTSVKKASNDYKAQLEDAGFTIESSRSVGGSKAGAGSFTAESDDWRVIVYRGGVTGENGAMSLQVLPKPTSGTSTTTESDG
jgi:hypothetical protein